MQNVLSNRLNRLAANVRDQLQLGHGFVTQLGMDRGPLNAHGSHPFKFCQTHLLNDLRGDNVRSLPGEKEEPRPRDAARSPFGDGRGFDATEPCDFACATEGVDDLVRFHARILGVPNNQSQGEPNNRRVTIGNMNTLAERIKAAMQESGATVTELARAVGVKPPSVHDWISGKTKSLKGESAIRAAKFLDVQAQWLTSGTGPKHRSETPPQLVDLEAHPDLVLVPRVEFKLSAGVSGYQVEVPHGNGKPIFFRRDWFETHKYQPDKLLAVRISGASMEPSLWDGDLVVINTEDTKPHDGDVFALNYEGEMVIKRLKRDAGEWWACSDNIDTRRYPPKRCTEDVQVIGRIVYRQGEKI